jgi:tetrahydromethanopterin S-methyltransferase subunit G
MTPQEHRARRIGYTIGRFIGLPLGLAFALLLLPVIAIEKLVNSIKGN